MSSPSRHSSKVVFDYGVEGSGEEFASSRRPGSSSGSTSRPGRSGANSKKSRSFCCKDKEKSEKKSKETFMEKFMQQSKDKEKKSEDMDKDKKKERDKKKSSSSWNRPSSLDALFPGEHLPKREKKSELVMVRKNGRVFLVRRDGISKRG